MGIQKQPMENGIIVTTFALSSQNEKLFTWHYPLTVWEQIVLPVVHLSIQKGEGAEAPSWVAEEVEVLV